MIVFENLTIMTRSDKPNEDWTNGEAKYVVEDDTELAAKIIEAAPYFKPIVKKGVLVDIKPLERPARERVETDGEKIVRLEQEIAHFKKRYATDIADLYVKLITEEPVTVGDVPDEMRENVGDAINEINAADGGDESCGACHER